MRARSSVGHDGVSVDLLRRIFEEHPNCLCELLTAVLATGCFPADWGDSLLALLPKTLWPTTARELRPIALSSAGMKLMSKIIITRAFSYLRDPSPWSACGCGRSTADLHGCMGRQRDLCGEWRLGIMVAKLDVEAAFDNDSRAAIADFLNKRLADTDAPHESRFLLLLLQENVLYGTAPGGSEVRVRCNRGIRQGSPEFAVLFGLLMSDVVNRLKAEGRWHDPRGVLGHLPADVGTYHDDVFISGTMSKNINALSAKLQKN